MKKILKEVMYLSEKNVVVIGAGLAGSEAAFQIARQNVHVDLFEMRPETKSPAHHTENFAELVCSNSLRAASLENAVGVLKEEMRLAGSLIMDAADQTKVPAGGALAVDRNLFSQIITEKILENKNISVHRKRLDDIPENEIVVVATGPLTHEILAEKIKLFFGEDTLHFYDAVAPIVSADSINFEKVWKASRYDKGEAAYLNCPMNEEEYEIFYKNLIEAETAEMHDCDKINVFEGCMPVEVMASRGHDTLLFGCLKSVGLIDPRTNERPFAVVQLRQENAEGTFYNLVGFQTHLKFPEQKRVFRLIPGLENAEFLRYGVMHRNTFIKSPRVLLPTMQTRKDEKIFFAGQMTGVEGYVESAASGLMAGVNAGRFAKNLKPLIFPRETAHGSLSHYITTQTAFMGDGAKHFQPMNINFGLMSYNVEGRRINKKEKRLRQAEQALTVMKEFVKNF